MKEKLQALLATINWPKEKAQAFLMWAISIPLTAKGFEAWMHGATSLLGALTALLGSLMALCGLIWWVRRLKRQSLKLMLDELQVRRMLENSKHRSRKLRSEEEEP